MQMTPAITNLLKHAMRKCFEVDAYKEPKQQTEQLRKEYTERSQDYHQRLKILGLADRMQGKIYDNLHSLLKNLTVENQVIFIFIC